MNATKTSTNKYTVKRQGKTWGIYCNGSLIEGGFFSRDFAQDECESYNIGESFKREANSEAQVQA